MLKAAVDKTDAAANSSLTDPNVKQRLDDVSAVIVDSTPEALGEHAKAELAKWPR